LSNQESFVILYLEKFWRADGLGASPLNYITEIAANAINKFIEYGDYRKGK
jgi:hypothetical protein